MHTKMDMYLFTLYFPHGRENKLLTPIIDHSTLAPLIRGYLGTAHYFHFVKLGYHFFISELLN